MTTEALTPYRANGNETAVTTYEAPSVGLAASLDDLVQNMRDYQAAVNALLTPDDYQGVGGKQFKKKSAWRKLAVAFGVTVSIVSKDVRYDEDGRIHHAEFVVRATARNGRFVDAWGGASIVDRDFSHDQDVAATAQTRATSRAISDLIGSGEVSAEEMAEGQRRSQAPQSAPALGKCPDGHNITEGKFGPQCKGKNPDGSWHNWRPPKSQQPAPAPDDSIPADFREVDESPDERGSGDDALQAAAAKLKTQRGSQRPTEASAPREYKIEGTVTACENGYLVIERANGSAVTCRIPSDFVGPEIHGGHTGSPITAIVSGDSAPFTLERIGSLGAPAEDTASQQGGLGL